MSTRILLASLMALSLAAQQAPPPGPPRGAGPMGRPAQAGERLAFLAHHLKLSEAQKAQVKEIHQKHQGVIQPKQKAAMEARETFRKAAQDTAASPEQLRKLHQAVADRQFDLMMERRAVKLEVRAVLTPEQRAEADRMQALGEEHRQFRMERMRKAMERRQGRPGMGPGGRGAGPGGLEADSD